MYERTFETVTIPAKSTRRIRFLQQRKHRLLTGVSVIDGGDSVRIGQVSVGATLVNRIGGDKPIPWPLGTYAAVEIHNDDKSIMKTMTVEMCDRDENDARDVCLEDKRISNPAQEIKIAHTIRIFVMDDGSVYGDVDGGKHTLMPIGTESTGESTTIDGQARSVMEQAFMKLIGDDFANAEEPKGKK